MDSIFNRRHFLKPDKELLTRFSSLSGSLTYVIDNLPYVLLRTNTISTSNNVDTFILSTSAHPNSTIEYTSETDLVDLSVRDGGTF